MKTKHLTLLFVIFIISTCSFAQSGTIKIAKPKSETPRSLNSTDSEKKAQQTANQRKYYLTNRFPFVVKRQRFSCSSIRML